MRISPSLAAIVWAERFSSVTASRYAPLVGAGCGYHYLAASMVCLSMVCLMNIPVGHRSVP